MYKMCSKLIYSVPSLVLLLVALSNLSNNNANGESVMSTKMPNSSWNATWMDLLKRQMLLNYDKFARPHQHYNATDVSVKLTVRHVDIDEVKSILTIYGWLKFTWADEKLKWNPADYGNLKVIHLADHEIWQPDVLLYNSASGSNIDHYGNTNCLIQYDGSVIWIPPTQFHTFCDLNMKYWPFDTQDCNIILGSWTLDGNQLNLTYEDSGSHLNTVVNNNEWEIISLKAARNRQFYEPYPEPYVEIEFNLTVKRQSPMFREIVFTPAVIVVFMTLSCFWLPPHAGERIILNGFIALIIFLLLIYFAQQLPTMAAEPLIILFYTKTLYMVTLSIIISIVVMNVANCTRKIPWFVKIVFDKGVPRYLFIQTNGAQVESSQKFEELRDTAFEDTPDDRQIIISYNNCPKENAWIVFAKVIDRIAFILYALYFVLLSIFYSV